MSTPSPNTEQGEPGRGGSRTASAAVIWLPGLAVAIAAAVATAHGLYEVAAAAGVPAGIAWLYPLITDGLALVAYAATARLSGSAARYAWAVVVTAAGLSGLAQAAYLAADPGAPVGAAAGAAVGFVAPGFLRFGVGAWPAIAAAVVAHLLYLLLEPTPSAPRIDTTIDTAAERSSEPVSGVQPPVFNARVQADAVVQPRPDEQPRRPAPPGVQPEPVNAPPARPALTAGSAESERSRGGESPARDRARTAARRHAARTGDLPTVSALQTLADVSRGTAAAALRDLRAQPGGLHLLPNPGPEADDTPSEGTQP